MYNELGLECLRDRRWIWRLCLFHKIFNLHLPKYLYDIIPSVTRSYTTRNNKNFPSFNCREEYFMNSFFPNVKNEWNKLDIKITNITSHNTFKSSSLSFTRLLHCDTFRIHNPIGLQLLTRLRTIEKNRRPQNFNFLGLKICHRVRFWGALNHTNIVYFWAFCFLKENLYFA